MIHNESIFVPHSSGISAELFLSHLIEGGEADEKGYCIRNGIEGVQGSHPELERDHYSAIDSTKRASVADNLGLWPGSVHVQLQLNGGPPAFDTDTSLHDVPELLVEPLSSEYARLPIDEAFDFNAIINTLKVRRILTDMPLYLVCFRSKLKADANLAILKVLDEKAHEAALESDSLIHYFSGVPDNEGNALSFCLWDDELTAKKISADTRHRAATAMVSAYESYSVEKYNVHHINATIRLVPR